MDILSNLKYVPGSRKNRKRIGRGEGSGHGGQSTRGMNGQLSRSGAKYRAWFEGGQMPLQRRIPKFGFKNIFKIYFQVVNLSALQRIASENKIDEVLTKDALKKHGLIKTVNKPVKILGKGELKVKVNVEADSCSSSAKEKIEAAGGSVKLITRE